MFTKVSNSNDRVQIRTPDGTKSLVISVHLEKEAMQFEYPSIKDALPPNPGRFPIYLVQIGISVTYPSTSAAVGPLASIVYIFILISTMDRRPCSLINMNWDYAKEVSSGVAVKI